MFKAVFSEQRGRRRIVTLNSQERIRPEMIDGVKHILLIADKRNMKVVKTAVMILLNRTTDPRYFDPEADADEIAAINEAAENLRIIYDTVSGD